MEILKEFTLKKLGLGAELGQGAESPPEVWGTETSRPCYLLNFKDW